MSVRVCKLMNAEANATLFSGETTMNMRDPIGTSGFDRLHQYVRDPVCAHPLKLARRIKLSLYPKLSEESGRKDFKATLDAVIDVLDGGSRLRSLDIDIHVSDHPTKKQVKDSVMEVQRFRIEGRASIHQVIYRELYENWIPGIWAHELL